MTFRRNAQKKKKGGNLVNRALGRNSSVIGQPPGVGAVVFVCDTHNHKHTHCTVFVTTHTYIPYTTLTTHTHNRTHKLYCTRHNTHTYLIPYSSHTHRHTKPCIQPHTCMTMHTQPLMPHATCTQRYTYHQTYTHNHTRMPHTIPSTHTHPTTTITPHTTHTTPLTHMPYSLHTPHSTYVCATHTLHSGQLATCSHPPRCLPRSLRSGCLTGNSIFHRVE